MEELFPEELLDARVEIEGSHGVSVRESESESKSESRSSSSHARPAEQVVCVSVWPSPAHIRLFAHSRGHATRIRQ